MDKSVVTMVMEMTENLLTMEDFEETPNAPIIDVGAIVNFSDNKGQYAVVTVKKWKILQWGYSFILPN